VLRYASYRHSPADACLQFNLPRQVVARGTQLYPNTLTSIQPLTGTCPSKGKRVGWSPPLTGQAHEDTGRVGVLGIVR